MDRWAAKYQQQAAFICVGCAGPALASQFASELKLSRCTVSYVDRANGPRWGQLGCNGFIVLDAQQHVVCDATSAFMEIRNLAFGHVEALLDALVAGKPTPRVCPGQRVVLRGLSKTELNGQHGICIGAAGDDGRCAVQLQRNGRQLAVKPENLLVGGESDSGGGGGGGCDDGSCSQGGGCDDGRCAPQEQEIVEDS